MQTCKIGQFLSCCRVREAGKTKSSVFARLSCRRWSFIHAEMSARQPEILAATIIWLKWKIMLCVISTAMIWETMCLYDVSQWCSVYREDDGSKNWSLRNISDQLMCFGYLPSPGHKTYQWDRIHTSKVEYPVTPSDESVDRKIWWFTMSKAADKSTRMRTDDLESAFANLKDSVTDNSAFINQSG